MVDAVSQPWRILVVGSSHNDIGWAGTPSEIAEHREHGIIDAVLDLLARDPHYAYAVEASLYADEYLARNPQRADYIRALVESGRLEWGGTYVQPYEGLYGGEALLRQVHFGRKSLADRYGIRARGAWNVDVQGRTRNLAQIYGAAGIEYLIVSRCRPGIYWWEAEDGTRLLVISLFQGHYGYPFLNTRVLHVSPLEKADDGHGDFDIPVAAHRLRDVVDRFEPFFEEHGLPRVLLVTVTADYAVPSADLATFIADWNARATDIAREFGVDARLEFGTADAYVSLLRALGALDRLPVVRGEMPNPWLYIHGPGHHKTVDALRRSQAALLTAERLHTAPALLGLPGRAGDDGRLDDAWRDHIYIDHGFGGLHGVGTDEVFRAKAESALHTGLVAIERAMSDLTDALGVGQDQLLVYNPLPRARADWVEAEISIADPVGETVELESPDGRVVTGHVLSQAMPSGARRGTATVGFVSPPVAGLAHLVLTLRATARSDEPEASWPGDAADLQFSNSHYKAVVTRGGIARLKVVRPDAPDLPVARTESFLLGESILLASPGIDVGEHEQDGSWDHQLPRPFQPRPSGQVGTGHRGSEPRVLFRSDEATRVMTEAPLGDAFVRNTYTFYRDLPYCDLQVDLLGWHGDHAREVRVCFPFEGTTSSAEVSYEVPFGRVHVGSDEIEDFGDMRPREVQTWIQARSADRELTLSGSVAVYDWLDPLSANDDVVLQAVLVATKRSCHPLGNWYEQSGDHTAHFRVRPAAAGESEPTTTGWGRELKLYARQGNGARSGADGTGASTPAWAASEAPNVLLTCLRPIGDDAVLARYWEHEGRDTRIELTSLPQGASLSLSDAFGDGRTPLPGRTVDLPAHGIVTVVVQLGRADEGGEG